MARRFICGFETGDFSEAVHFFGSGGAVQSTIVKSGGYAAKFAAAVEDSYSTATGLNLTRAIFKGAFRFSAAPTGGGPGVNLLGFINSSGAEVYFVHLPAGSLQLAVLDGAYSTVGTGPTLSVDTWYNIELDLTVAGGGAGNIKLRVDGVEAINSTRTTNTWGNVDFGYFGSFTEGSGGPGCDLYVDDVVFDDASAIGLSKIIARQFTTGTPTYNGWTKTGGSGTIESVWNNTPFDTTQFAVSPSQTAAIAQTGFIASFSATQTGHGTDVIAAGDTINAIKIGAVAKASSTANSRGLGALRARFNGADSDTNVTITTGNAYYGSSLFTDTLAHLNAAEAGWNRRASTTAGTQTVEDAWTIVEYTPALTAALLGRATARTRGRGVQAGAVPVIGRSRSGARGRLASSARAPLSGRTKAGTRAKSGPTAVVGLAGRAKASGQAKGVLAGVLALLARSSMVGRARSVLEGSVSLLGRARASAAGRALAGLLAELYGRAGALSRGLAAPGGSAGFSGRSGSLARGSGAAGFAAALAGRAAGLFKARGVLTGTGALTALSGLSGARFAGRAGITAAAALLGRARSSASAVAAAVGSVSLAGRSRSIARARAGASLSLLLAASSMFRAAARRAGVSGAAALVGRTQSAVKGRFDDKIHVLLSGRSTARAAGRLLVPAMFLPLAARATIVFAGRLLRFSRGAASAETTIETMPATTTLDATMMETSLEAELSMTTTLEVAP